MTRSTFAGRESECALLSQLLHRTQAGQGGLVLVTGEPGIGKTALLGELLQQATNDGMHTLVGHCYDLSAPAPYQPWVEAFDRWTDHVAIPAGLSPQGDIDPTHHSQESFFRDVLDTLTAASHDRPVLIALEDMHWSDPASLELLRYVNRRLDGRRVLLLITYREQHLQQADALRRAIPNLIREAVPPPEHLPLAGLSSDAIGELVDQRYAMSGDDRSRLIQHLQTRTEGNPFFIQEILRSLEEERTLEPIGRTWRLWPFKNIQVPPLVRHVIEDRLARLDRETLELLQVAAVIGQNVPLELWQSVSSVSEDYLIEIAEQAIDAYVLEEVFTEHELQFSHALVRETLYDTLSLPRRRVWHRRVAERMDAAGHAPDNIAFHFERAGDVRAIYWYIRAGERARRIAWLTAADLFKSALRLMEDAGYDAQELGWLSLRVALLNRFAEPDSTVRYIERAMQFALDTDDELLQACALCARGAQRRIMGDVRDGIAEERAGVAALDTLNPRDQEQVLRLVQTGFWAAGLSPHANLAGVLADVGRFDTASALAHRLITESRAFDDIRWHTTTTIIEIGPLAFYGLGAAAAAGGDPDSARVAFAHARDGLRAVHDHVLAGCVALWELLWLALPFYADDPGFRDARAADAEHDFSRAEGAQGGWSPRMAWLPVLVLEGEWDEAHRLAEASYWESRAWPRYEFTQTVLARLARERGEPGKAWEHVLEVFTDGPTTEPGGIYFLPAIDLLQLAVELSLDTDDTQSARCWLDAYDRWLDWSDATLGRAESHCLWAVYYRAIGEMSAACAQAELALSIASEPRQPLSLIRSHRMLGELLTQSGRWADAEQHILDARQIAIACRAPLETTECQLTLATLRAVQKRKIEARELAAEARESCLSLGAERVRGTADTLLAQLEGSVAIAAYPSGLSAREYEVLTLVVAGLTNTEIADRLFLSRRTVEQHLRSVYKKLGVTSRVAATRYAMEHGLT